MIPKVSPDLFDDICGYCRDPLLEKSVVAHKVNGKYQCLNHEECVETYQKTTKVYRCIDCRRVLEPKSMTAWEAFKDYGRDYTLTSFCSIAAITCYLIYHMNQFTRGERGHPPFLLFQNKYPEFFAERHQKLSLRFGETMNMCPIPTLEAYNDYISRLDQEIAYEKWAFLLNFKINIIGAYTLAGAGSAKILDFFNTQNFRDRVFSLIFVVTLLYGSYLLCKESAPYYKDDFVLGMMGVASNFCAVYVAYLYRERNVLERVISS
jgi:hypothetical protein